MATVSDAEYYAGRMQQHRGLAAVAVNETVRAVHLDMVQRYANLIGENTL